MMSRRRDAGHVNEAFASSEPPLETVDLNADSSDDEDHRAGGRAGHDFRRNGRDNGGFAAYRLGDDGGDNFVAIHLGPASPGEVAPTKKDATNGVGNGCDEDEKKKLPGVVEDEDERMRCGVLMFRPKWLQRFRTAKWALFWLCWAGTLQGMVVNGFVNVCITTIERRFGLRSSQTGIVAGGYDVASFLCLTPVTYLGGSRAASKPRWLGWGAALMGLGSLVFALPHFAGPPYRGGAVNESVACVRLANLTHKDGCDLDGVVREGGIFSGSSGSVLLVFLGAQLLHGAGASPLFTLGVTYIDENVSKKMSSVYLGIFYTMAIVGPAMGYVIGGQLLKIYSEFVTVDPATLGLTVNSNVWIGAWWIGFFLSAALCWLIALPLMSFPPSLPGAEEIQKEKVSEAYDGESSRTEAFTKIRELPHAFAALMRNPTFVFLNLGGATEGMILSGFSAFLPKLIENQFSVTASWAAMLMGIITVPAGGGGTFFGGYLVKRLKLQCTGILKFCVWTTFFAVLFSGGFMITCPNLQFAGLTQPYGQNTPNPQKIISLESSCNQGCSCSRSIYNPVCGVDGVMYYSPCHAGCAKEISTQDSKLYAECVCINPSNSTSHERNETMPYRPENVWTTEVNNKKIEYEAINTVCTSGCQYLWLFLVLIFVCMFFTFLSTMPALSATLRCVREDQRSFALGIQWIKVRLFGTIPAPLIFGILIDKSCILWQNSCDGKGACLVYNNFNMGRYMLGLALMAKAGSLLFFFLAWWFYKAPQHSKIISVPSVNVINDSKQTNHTQINGGSVNNESSERF